jgi:hypothetical protein
MNADEVPDWRIHFAARVADAGTDASAESATGMMVMHLARTKTREEGLIALPVVSPYRLALSISIDAAKRARSLRGALVFSAREKGQRERVLELSSMPSLFDYFEASMVAATFAYQALETYSNARIEESLVDDATIELEHRGKLVTFDVPRLQRDVSTREKIATVLPRLSGVELAKRSKLWQDFAILDHVRDSTMHLKSANHFLRGGAVDRETLFYRLLNNPSTSYPRTALGIMRHFSSAPSVAWLEHAEELMSRS